MNACAGRSPRGHLPAVAPAFAALLFCIACAGGSEPEQAIEPVAVKPPLAEPVAEDATEETVEAPSGRLQLQVVELYFPSAKGDGLVAEAREIFITAAPGDRAKQIVADLITGPATDLALRSIPRATRLRQIYVLDNGVAYVDFSKDLRAGLGGGSAEEMLAVYSIVDSVVLNIPEIRRVGILIDGKPVETLNGHLDLRRPLGANVEMIVGRVASIKSPSARSTSAS